jgi:hypothetical protein
MVNPYLREEVEHLARRQSQISAHDHDARDPPRRDRLVAVQAEYDPTFRRLGGMAPPPGADEGVREYRGRLAAALAPYTATYKDANIFALVPEPAIETQIRDEVARTFADRHRGEFEHPGQMRKVEVTNPETGAQHTEWRGDNATWMSMFMPPYQLATEIKTFDRAGNPAPPVIRWGTPPVRR